MDDIRTANDSISDPFPADPTGLPEATSTPVVELRDDSSFELTAAPVRKRLGDHDVRMLAYNGSIPGPTLRLAQDARVTVRFTNRTDLDSTVHWHGLRIDNRFDGVPLGHHQGMQAPVPVGGSYTYQVHVPDPGAYWYHPHIREDYAQELGLYGSIVVVPSDPAYWSPVNRELTLALDDILLRRGVPVPFSRSHANRTVMGRFGNVMLINGAPSWTLEARRGEVVRLYLTNTANVRDFNVALPGARLKLVGGDNGRVEREVFVEELLLAPSERVVVDALFERPGRYPLEHRSSKRTYTLGSVLVREEPVARSFAREFATLRRSAELLAARRECAADFDRAPDKVLALAGSTPGVSHHGEHHGGEATPAAVAREDARPEMNRMSTPETMLWQLVDRQTGAANNDIHWTFRVGDRVKIRIVNEPHADHAMPHPIHFHGQRFLVLSRDGRPNDNLVWKDTVRVGTGETVDILLEVSNPGAWMVHCHIAEHLESGMMFSFDVV